jgi:CRP/FNR family transcriptional regulator, cyclic AMP receptor protein
LLITKHLCSVIVRLEKPAILRVIHKEPAFSEKFIAHLLGRRRLVDQLLNLSGRLLLFANFGKERAPSR